MPYLQAGLHDLNGSDEVAKNQSQHDSESIVRLIALFDLLFPHKIDYSVPQKVDPIVHPIVNRIVTQFDLQSTIPNSIYDLIYNSITYPPSYHYHPQDLYTSPQWYCYCVSIDSLIHCCSASRCLPCSMLQLGLSALCMPNHPFTPTNPPGSVLTSLQWSGSLKSR